MKMPSSPNKGIIRMMIFTRVLDKIRLNACGELREDFRKNPDEALDTDGACADYQRISYDKLRDRVLTGGTEKEVLRWSYMKDRPLNQTDLGNWNEFTRNSHSTQTW
jgi:hypothetical protein